jgi:hypothetical protein
MKVFVYFLLVAEHSRSTLKSIGRFKIVEDTFSKVSKGAFSFLFFLDKEMKQKNQERTPTPIFFGAHSAGTREKLQFSPFVHVCPLC